MRASTWGEPFLELRRCCINARATAETPGEVNRAAFGKPGSSRGKAAFPQVRLMALIKMGTRAPLIWTQRPYRESKTVQARRLHAHLGPDQLLLADRGIWGGTPGGWPRTWGTRHLGRVNTK